MMTVAETERLRQAVSKTRSASFCVPVQTRSLEDADPSLSSSIPPSGEGRTNYSYQSTEVTLCSAMNELTISTTTSRRSQSCRIPKNSSRPRRSRRASRSGSNSSSSVGPPPIPPSAEALAMRRPTEFDFYNQFMMNTSENTEENHRGSRRGSSQKNNSLYPDEFNFSVTEDSPSLLRRSASARRPLRSGGGESPSPRRQGGSARRNRLDVQERPPPDEEQYLLRNFSTTNKGV